MKPTSLHSFIICTAFVISCSACGDSSKTDEQTDADTAKTAKSGLEKDARTIGGDKSGYQLQIDQAQKEMEASESPITGYWVGKFGNNVINLTLTSISAGEIKGFSVCAGNYRPIEGTIQLKKANPHAVVMNEPGDDKYDGKFEFTVDTRKNELKGKWTPFKEKGNTAKEYTLVKKEFIYNPDAGDYPEASKRILTEADVENKTAEELEIMRNEIYARHGYSFKNKKMRAYFEEKSWYMPVGVDIREQLSETEVKNIDLIYRYEEYYKVSYDDYGR